MNDFIYKYVDLNGLKIILKNQTLKFSNPLDFNDPFEFHDNLVDRKLSAKHQLEIYKKFDKNITREKLKWYKKEIKEDLKKPQSHLIKLFEEKKLSTRVTCFSEINDNILMWAHYADKHNGACIKFDTKKLFSSFKTDSYLSNVKYHRRIITKKYSKLRENAIEHWISSKSKDWKYEKEVRIILGSSTSNILPFDIASINDIIFGCKLTEEQKIDIEKLIFQEMSYDWIKTREMKISNTEYKLEINNRW